MVRVGARVFVVTPGVFEIGQFWSTKEEGAGKQGKRKTSKTFLPVLFFGGRWLREGRLQDVLPFPAIFLRYY